MSYILYLKYMPKHFIIFASLFTIFFYLIPLLDYSLQYIEVQFILYIDFVLLPHFKTCLLVLKDFFGLLRIFCIEIMSSDNKKFCIFFLSMGVPFIYFSLFELAQTSSAMINNSSKLVLVPDLRGKVRSISSLNTVLAVGFS